MMVVDDFRFESGDPGALLRARVGVPSGDTTELMWRVRSAMPAPFSAPGDAALAATLLVAMARGEPLTIEAPVSEQLLATVPRLMDVFGGWFPRLRRVEVRAPSTRRPHGGDAVGVFFSGGVDSFYSLLTHDAEITHLVLVQGFDISPEHSKFFATVADSAERVAAAMGKQLVTVETNLRGFATAPVGWGLYHGAAMGSVALALSGLLGRMLISASYATADLYPFGSHPLTDPLWSTEAVNVGHVGTEANRWEKLVSIAQHLVALENLRVCLRHEGEHFNCGRCGKCMRAIAGLHALGVLDKCTTLPDSVDLRGLGRLRVVDDGGMISSRNLLKGLMDLGGHEELVRAIRRHIRYGKVRLAAQRVVAAHPRMESAARRAYRSYRSLERALPMR